MEEFEQEYVTKSAVAIAILDAFAYGKSAFDMIKAIPAADVRPVMRGRWIYEPGHIPRCSVCGRYSDDADTGEAICCPFCGAKMEEET